jgi:hypothetical protein
MALMASGSSARGETAAPSPKEAKETSSELARARALDREGVRAYKEERYNDAIRYFSEAFRLGGPATELWNIAKCHARLDQPEEAAGALEEYLAQPGLSASDRAEATQQLQDIKRRRSTLTVASSPPGATVYVDGRRNAPAGTTPLSLEVGPGAHTVTIEHAGYEPHTKRVEASYGRAVIVDAQLTRGDSPPPAASTPRDKQPAPATARYHHVTIGAQIGALIPRYGGVGGPPGVAGALTGGYVVRDASRLVITLGGRFMISGDHWSNNINAPDTGPGCSAPLGNKLSATALAFFANGALAYRVTPRIRVGGDLGIGLAAYAADRVGGDVFFPTCSPSPGVQPAFHLGGEASYALNRDVRIVVSPIILEMQSAFAGVRTTPRDASGMWLRFGAGVGLAFDLF